MFSQKQIAEYFFKNIGLAAIFIGIAFLIFGAINFNNLPHAYIAQAGDPGSDGLVTVLLNGILWLTLSAFLLIMGIELYFSGKRLAKNQPSDDKDTSLKFFLFGVTISSGLMVYILLLLLHFVTPIQFFPSLPFGGVEVQIDLSVLFNSLLLYFLLSIIYRVSYKFIKYGIKIGGIQ